MTILPKPIVTALFNIGRVGTLILTTEEAGRILAELNPNRTKPYSVATVGKWCRAGKLPGARNMGRDWAIPLSAFVGFRFPKVGRPPNDAKE